MGAPMHDSTTSHATPIAPAYVSQRTALAVVGLTPRAFREAVIKHRIPCTRLGNQVLVRLEDWHAAMARLAAAAPPDAGTVRTASQILADLGVRRTAR